MSWGKSGTAEVVSHLRPALACSELPSFEQIARSTRILDLLPAAIYVTDAQGRIIYFNDAAVALWGCRPKLNSDQWCGSWRLFRPDGTVLPHDQCPMAIALKEGRPSRSHQAVAERPDGTRVPFMAFPTPLYDASGALGGAVNMLVDISENERAEYVERRLASIVESSDDAIISKNLDGIITTWNRAAERLFGYLAQEAIGQSITILIPDGRQDEETEILERIRRGERIDHFETMRRRKDGTLVNISLTVSPVADESGKIVGASKIARDITEQKRKEEQIVLLAREADHRTKNLLAIAQATVHLTHAETVTDLKAAIEGRLQALANAHALLAKSRWAGADLHELAVVELSAYVEKDNARVQIDGTSLLLESASAQAMAVALHELATNSAKYGALSISAGQVKVEWRLERGRQVHVCWTEIGGPSVTPPSKEGFGTRAITRMIEQLNGNINFDWRVNGVICDIMIPA